MRILDLDMDFFLDNRVPRPTARGSRLSKADYAPWCEAKVRSFLECNCCLSPLAKSPGRVFVRHNEVYDALCESKQETPIKIVHVDAHADLGLLRMPEASVLQYVCTELLWEEVATRPSKLNPKFLCEGSWLLLAIANDWISDLTYVHHATHKGNDYPRPLDHWRGNNSVIRLPRLTKDKYQYGAATRQWPDRIGFEVEVPFRVISPEDFRADEPFDRVFLTKSPEYTPAEVDDLLPIVAEFIDF